MSDAHHPPLRSFGRLKARPIKPRQAALMETRLPALRIPGGQVDLAALMPGAREIWLEVGFGGGEHMAAQAGRAPDVLILGAEPFVNGVASAVRHIDEQGLGNVRLHDGDVLNVGGVAIAYRAPGGESVSRPTVTAMGPHVGELLTPAQRRVLIALCRPFRDATYATPATNQQIADELVVSVDAVKSTLRALFEVFGVDALPQNQKRASLALQALRTGVITRRDL